jgi:hypothetical protein
VRPYTNSTSFGGARQLLSEVDSPSERDCSSTKGTMPLPPSWQQSECLNDSQLFGWELLEIEYSN